MLYNYSNALLFMIIGVGFLAVIITVGKLLRPDRPTPEKMTPYECGEDPVGESYVHFNIRFYVIALIFLIFEVEIAMLFPWAITFDSIVDLVKMFLFVGVLLLGLLYSWAKGDLEWIQLPKRPIQEREQKGELGTHIKKREGRVDQETREEIGIRV